MEIKVENVNLQTSVIRLSGELDMLVVPMFRSTVTELTGKGIRNLILNLRDLQFIDSSGVGAVVFAYKTLTEKGGKLLIVRPNPITRQILEMSGICNIISICTTEQAALARLGYK